MIYYYHYIIIFYCRSNKVDKKLFNWNEYVEYIECRNSIISEFNYVLHKNIYGNNIRKTQLFINDWNIRKSTIPITKSTNLLYILFRYLLQ